MPPRDQLKTYQRKRDFTKTPEPAGEPGPDGDGARRFVVQRHRASRLHYDFRLEIDGVLVSWAVPKGPTLDPKVRRGAYHVEDHPLEYFDFEGVIPGGEYGGGDVIVWDAGTWEPHKFPDPGQAVRSGELHLDVYGAKLRGRFVLVRTSDPGDKENWLLLHKRDDFAIEGWDPEDHPQSVLSGRTNDEVKADPDRLWRSDLPAAQAAIALKANAVSGPTPDELAALDELPKAGTWDVLGRELRVTNLDKVLFPARTKREKPVTKREFLRYSAQIAPTVLPYLTRRALTVRRFRPTDAPDWLPTCDGRPVVDEAAALVWAANLGVLEWHTPMSRVDEPEQPTHVLIDLGPDESTKWTDALRLARLHRTALEHLGLVARAAVTGRRGIQIWVPIEPGPSFAETRAWARQLSAAVGEIVPELTRADVTHNATGKAVVAPYSPRPAPGAPVSVPIDWDELDDRKLRPDRWTIRTVLDRIEENGDLFRAVLGSGQQLPTLS
jgi:bifunctional non-homologous end joining protein LigD